MPEKTQPSAEAMRAARAILDRVGKGCHDSEEGLAEIIDREFAGLQTREKFNNAALLHANEIASEAMADREKLLAENAALRAISTHAVGCMDLGCRICSIAITEV